jgi:hypothetical protein
MEGRIRKGGETVDWGWSSAHFTASPRCLGHMRTAYRRQLPGKSRFIDIRFGAKLEKLGDGRGWCARNLT